MNESAYLQTLNMEAAERYRIKSSVIGNIDPYTLKRKELVESIDLYPAITYPNIVNHFLFAPIPLTSDELKCY